MADSNQIVEVDANISFSLGDRSLSDLVEPEDYIINVKGSIYADGEIGRLSGYILQVNRALEEKQNLFEVCDAHSQTLMHYYGALFDEDTHELKEPICKQFDWPRTGDVLILDRIEVLAAYRKHRIGLAAACSFIDTFGGDTDGLVVGTPHPLQFSTDTLAANKEWAQKMQYENFSRNKKLATTKLQNHWAKLGMKRLKGIKINGSPVYGLSLSLKRPTTAQVLRMP